MNVVKNYMIKYWDFGQLFEMFYNKEGYFLLKFLSFKNIDIVLMKGPYTIHNRPMFLKEWQPDFCLKRDTLRTLPDELSNM